MAIDPYSDNDNLPFIIAEIGINHNGDISIAKKLIDMTKECGVNVVKFQKRTVDIVYTSDFLNQPRQNPWGLTQRAQKEALELNKEEYDEIDKYCRMKSIPWFASAWDEESQKFLRPYNLPFNKIASAMLTHKRLLEMVAEERKHTFISTGMSTFRDVDKALEIFDRNKCPYTLMHCVSVYPCPDEWCNIRMLETLKKRYNCRIGYSGHELGIVPSVIAVVLGAEAIERHITLDRSMYGSDQSASLEKYGLEILIRDTRDVKKILGKGEKTIIPAEEKVAYKLKYFRELDFKWHDE